MYEFETDRLGFRQWQDRDKLPFAKMNSNAEVMKYFPNTLTNKQSDEFVERIVNHFKNFGYGLWAVDKKNTKEFIGYIGFLTATFVSDFTPCIEIGWRLDNRFWNNGFATEGAKKCLLYGFNILKFKDIYSFTSILNKQSIKVMEKIGLRRICTFNHPKIENNHPLQLHVLYNINEQSFINFSQSKNLLI
ncbi:MAG: GNAT family N-acetyltransferase [Candidatus Cloacimonetes bacterium]|nr:GNAT family N-acetyltransferase [Candidatus Cloacimonadota bacterium]